MASRRKKAKHTAAKPRRPASALRLALQERDEALRFQAATAEILVSLSRSSTDARPVFEAIVANVLKLFRTRYAAVFVVKGEELHLGASRGDANLEKRRGPAFRKFRASFPQRIDWNGFTGRALRSGKVSQIAPIIGNPKATPQAVQLAKDFGYDAMLVAPLMKEGKAIGAIGTTRPEGEPFAVRQLALFEAFAAQAVIAIENARLFNETKEALERQTAISEVLTVISGSPADLAPILEAVASRAARLCDASDARIFLVQGHEIRHAAGFGDLPVKTGVFPVGRGTSVGTAIADGRVVHVRDIEQEGDKYPVSRDIARKAGWRTTLNVPLMRERRALGAISLRRAEVRPFTDRQAALLKVFADQAAIAIENARLFNETRESLERQTATAEILRVISSSPTDTQPVFQAIVEAMQRLFAGKQTGVVLRRDSRFTVVGYSGGRIEDLPAEVRNAPLDRERNFPSRAILDAEVVQVTDWGGGDVPEHERLVAKTYGVKAGLFVPLLRNGEGIGALVVLREAAGLFEEKEVALLRSFADQAVIAIENARLFNETREALAQQTASSKVLGVISGSPSDLKPVFDSILESASELCDAHLAVLNLYDGTAYRTVAQRGTNPEFAQWLGNCVFKPDPATSWARVVRDRQPLQVPDLRDSAAYRSGVEYAVKFADMGRARTYLIVPLVKDGRFLGAIAVFRPEVRLFSDKQLELLQTFARQAIIAMENVRLFNETKEALERQTATSDILKVIAGSPADVKPVFDAILRSAVTLCGAELAAVFPYDGKLVHMTATHNWPQPALEYFSKVYPSPPDPHLLSGRTILNRAVVQIPDAAADEHYDPDSVATGHWRRMIGVPMLREGRPLGAMVVAWRDPGEAPPGQVELLQTFADQAAIAVENVRLFNETKEALEQQTATSTVLSVISSSPTNTEPVFEAIAERAAVLCAAESAFVTTYDGHLVHMRAFHGTRPEATALIRAGYPMQPTSGSAAGRAIRDAVPVQIPDVLADPEYAHKEAARDGGWRSTLSVPMVRDDRVVGAISVARAQTGVFPDKQLALLKTFADQAVIAIENARLFNETEEALERQTATADILRVISGSPTNVQPVFEAILDKAIRLCDAHLGGLFLQEPDGAWTMVSYKGDDPEVQEAFRRVEAGPHTGFAKLAQLRRPVHIPDLHVDSDTAKGDRLRVLTIEKLKARTFFAVPLLKEGEVVGAVVIYRREVRPFSEAQIRLVTTFADQAVIAIENVRLFNETKEALERQTATAEVLKVISSSPTDVKPVFEALINRAAHLCEAEQATLVLVDGEFLRPTVSYSVDEGPLPLPSTVIRASRDYITGRAVCDGDVVNVEDAVPLLDKEFPGARENQRALGFRSMLVVPLMRDGRAIGAIGVWRRELRRFSDKHVSLLKTFADQAVIAIENVRLFNETKESLERQTATAEILKVISSSPTDVQPVFETIARFASRLCGGAYAIVTRFDGDLMHLVAEHNARPGTSAPTALGYPRRPGRDTPSPRAIHERVLVHIPYAEQDADLALGFARAVNAGSFLAVPMLREDVPIGTIGVSRSESGPFPDKQIELVKVFADQAVIAIENVRLFNETKEALEQQKASADVLGAISGSIADTRPVFEKILASCERLFEGELVGITLADGDTVRLAAYHGPRGEQLEKVYPLPLTRESGTGWAILNARIAHFPDIEAGGVPPGVVAGCRTLKVRAIVFAPMLFEGKGIGAIWVARAQPGAFTDKQIAHLRTFADQAVIAIQNARLFREIQEKSAQLEVANKHKSDFLANMSHELRTPLNAIIGFSEVLSERMFGEVNEKQAEYLKDIHESGRHLLSLINDILDLSKIEAGRMELELSTFDLPAAVSNAMTLVRERAQRHGIQLGIEMDPRLGAFQADERKVKQILLNLLSNAVKFTPDGGRVDVSARMDTDKVEIAVKDTGIGIAAEDHAAVFEEFKQVGGDYTRKAEGTGLGLALTKRLVELHGGEIALESAPGKGSTFTVKLPLR